MDSAYIPDDVIVDILARLPVKSLLRFRCVSRSWCTHITSPSFIAKHLNYSQRKENGRLLVHNIDHDARRYAISIYPDKSLTDPAFEYLIRMKAGRDILGPCNGIFCLVNFPSPALWNPATREFRLLPKLPDLNDILPEEGPWRHLIGFGVDPFTTTDDFKVVSIRSNTNRSSHDATTKACYPKRVDIYSFRDDSWREFAGFFPECDPSPSVSFYMYVDGVYYWGAYDKNGRDVILTFHMGYEVFDEITVTGLQLRLTKPVEFADANFPRSSTFGMYKGSMARITSYPCSGYETKLTGFDIWVLRGGDWCREIVVGPFEGAIEVIGFWKNGELLVVKGRGDQFYLADPITLEMKDLGPEAFLAFIYHETLVSVKRGNQDYELDYGSFNSLPPEFDLTDEFSDSDSNSDHA